MVAGFYLMLARRFGRWLAASVLPASGCGAVIPPLACSEALCSPRACRREGMLCWPAPAGC